MKFRFSSVPYIVWSAIFVVVPLALVAVYGLTGTDVTWDSTGAVSKQPKGMVIQNGAYVGLD